MARNSDVSPEYQFFFKPTESITGPASLKHEDENLDPAENGIQQLEEDVYKIEAECIPLKDQIAAQEMIRITLGSQVTTLQRQLTSRKVALDAFREVVRKER